MTRIFVHVYLDEDVDVLVANSLNSRGFPATTARDSGQLGKNDEEQLEYAISQKSAILTHNRSDFEKLAEKYFEREKHHYGIILAVRKPYHEIVQRLLTILNTTTADEMENQVIYI